jgi:serine phosphatase RsbU (regulator of sigma subunit)
MRGERYGKERVQRCLSDFKHYPAEKMAQLSFNSLQNFVSQEISDDVTILALKYQFES